MKELNDYSGPYIKDLKPEDFSKDCLIRLLREYSSAFETFDDRWWAAAAKVVPEKQLIDMSMAAWRGYAQRRHPKIAKALNIEIKDIADVIKLWQVLPDGIVGGLYDIDLAIQNGDRNHVIYTLNRCRTLEYFENKAPERITQICSSEGHERQYIEDYLRIFFPNAEVKALKLPPRKNPNDIACQWEFTLKSK